MIGPPLAPMGTFSLLTLPGDNGTWSITIWAAAADTVLRKVRDPDAFAKVLQACPFHAHWLNGQPITEVLAMASILDKYRRFVVDDQPIATGVAAVGDAWACTNPSAGRGISVGLFHAQCLRDATRAGLDDPEAFVRAFDELTETKVAPYFWNQINDDKQRIAEMDALREGEEPPPPDPTMRAFLNAAMYDADVFRGMLEMRLCLALPQDILARPGFREKVDAYRDAPERDADAGAEPRRSRRAVELTRSVGPTSAGPFSGPTLAWYTVVFCVSHQRSRAWKQRNGYTLFSATPAPSAHIRRPNVRVSSLGSSYTLRETCPEPLNTGVCIQ